MSRALLAFRMGQLRAAVDAAKGRRWADPAELAVFQGARAALADWDAAQRKRAVPRDVPDRAVKLAGALAERVGRLC